MAQCPHCSESIDSLSGFMPTADVEKLTSRRGSTT